jgi:flagellar biosynthesis protein FliQ
MTEDFVIHLFREAFYTALIIASPILLVSLVVGLMISVLQAATSVQEVTLTFVPKIVMIAIVLVLALPWIMDVMSTFTLDLFSHIPTIGHR